MCAAAPEPAESVIWARRVNSRWIVRQGLGENAEMYLKHLEAIDPDRLIRSCELARQLVRKSEPGEDPKPWFYAGLFGLARRDEAERFLQGHWFTPSCIPSLVDSANQPQPSDQIAERTQDKISRIREALEQLQQEN